MKLGNNTKVWEPMNLYGEVDVGDNCSIGAFCDIGGGVKIGNNVKIQAHSFIPGGVIIEDDAFIGPGVVFTNDKYPSSKDYGQKMNTVVRKGASIGANATILCGIEIGAHAKIGAGSVVTKSIPPNVVACGNPARVRAGKLSSFR